MREIKFRVYYEAELNGEVLKGIEEPCSWFLLTQTGEIMEYGPISPPSRPNKGYTKLIPLFYTGLKDKNGEEIYEGDIVIMTVRENIGTFNVPDDIIANNGYTGRDDIYKGAVIYNTNLASFGIDDKENDFIQLVQIEDMFLEVIGNIYENPELLK